MSRISKNQKKILENLKMKPEMTTKEIAELIYVKIIHYKSKEYASTYRSLLSLERQGIIRRVHVQLRWRQVEEDKTKR